MFEIASWESGFSTQEKLWALQDALDRCPNGDSPASALGGDDNDNTVFEGSITRQALESQIDALSLSLQQENRE